MAASASDKWRKYKSRFSTTLSTGIGTGTSDTLTPATVTGLPTDTAVTLFIDRVDSTGTKTPTKLEAIKGVISGGNLTSYVRAVEGTEQAHTGGAVVEMVWNAADWNDAIDSFLTEHNQDGTHKAATFTNKTLTSPILSGTGGTAAGQYGYDATNKAIYIGDGAAKQSIYTSVWKAYTPSLTNITIGDGTISGKYCLIGKTVHYVAQFNFKTTTSIAGAIKVGLPLAAKAGYATWHACGNCVILDSGTAYFFGYHTLDGDVIVLTTNATYAQVLSVTGSVPMTWANNDVLVISGTYETS